MLHAMHKLHISRSALENNIKILSKNTRYLMPVVKFNAYGHGLVDIAKLCLDYDYAKKIIAFAVGNIEEGVRLRKSLALENNANIDILALLGEIPLFEKLNEKDIYLAKEHSIITVVHNKEGLKNAVENGIPFALKWNTGMNRLGFSFDELAFVMEYVENNNADFKYNLSHMSSCDILSPEADIFTQNQSTKLDEITKALKEKFPHILSSIGQSGSVLANENPVSDVSRPGVSLYGANPFYNTKWEDLGSKLKPVMSISVPIVSVREVLANEVVGYGIGSRMEKDCKVAVAAIGYSNGYRRSVVSEGIKPKPVYGLYNDKRVERVNNVCMQLSFFDVTGTNAREGEEIFILGGEGKNAISPSELAKWWDTISYEVLCQLSLSDLRTLTN